MSESLDAPPEDNVEQPATVDELPESQWWVAADNEPTGPFNEAYVIASIRSGVIVADQLIRPVGANTWRPVSAWPQMRDYIPQQPAAAPVAPPITAAQAVGAITPTVDWIRLGVIYGLFVNPLMWCQTVTGVWCGGAYLSPEAASYGTAIVIVTFGLLASCALTVMWFIGGWWLRSRMQRGLWAMLAAAIATNVYVIVSIIAVVSLVIAASDQPAHQSSDLQNALNGLSLSTGLLEFAFTNVLVVMLWLKRKAVSWADGPFH